MSRVIVTLSHVVSRVVSSVVSPISLRSVDDSVVHFILSNKSFIVDSASVVISRSVSDEFLLSDIDLKIKGQKRSFGVISYELFHMTLIIYTLIVTWKNKIRNLKLCLSSVLIVFCSDSVAISVVC